MDNKPFEFSITSKPTYFWAYTDFNGNFKCTKSRNSRFRSRLDYYIGRFIGTIPSLKKQKELLNQK